LEGLHLGAGAELGESGADALVGHGRHPETLDGLLALRGLEDVAEDEFALAAGVAGVENGGDVVAGEEFFEELETLLGLLDGLHAELARDDREGFEAPEAVLLLVDIFGHLELDQVADGGTDDVLVVLENLALLRDFAQGAGNVGGDAGFLGDDECFGHEGDVR